nr:unnamed protein product [Callosobruchus analis]
MQEDPHGMEKMVDSHKDVVRDVAESTAEDQEKVEALVITDGSTDKIFIQQEFNLCSTCPIDGGKCILCQNIL